MTTKRTAEERANIRFLDPLIAQYGDEEWAEAHSSDMRFGFATCIREEVEPLEAENAKLRALVQRLVDALGHIEVPPNLLTDKVKAAVLAIYAAKEQGFVPTNTTQDNG